MAKYFDRDTKVAYVEQINSGKMTVAEAVNELGCSRSEDNFFCFFSFYSTQCIQFGIGDRA